MIIGNRTVNAHGFRVATRSTPPSGDRLRILWLSHFVPYPPRGGAFQRSYHLLREAGRRHKVHLVALNMRAVLATENDLAEAIEHLSAFTTGIQVFPNAWDQSTARRWAMAAGSY